jgi:DtxR family Mn-dependent transcriptional regulator
LAYRNHVTDAPKWRSSSIEDYVKVIYGLREHGDDVTTSSLAARVGVSASSASGMVRKLAGLGLVAHRPYGTVELTAEGMRLALEMIRRHRLIELFLAETLGYSWDEVHDEAETMEHAVSDRFIERVYARLGEPTVDPHGDPIPAKDGRISEPDTRRLAELEPGTEGEIARVSDADPDLLRYLSEHGIRLGAPIRVVERQPFGGPLVVRVGHPPKDTERTFGDVLAGAVSVRITRT